MDLKFAYLGHSALRQRGAAQELRLVPNLARDPVAFDGPLAKPLRFREAMSALHDTVISDLRFKKKDKTAYKTWKADQARQTADLHRKAVQQVTEEIRAKHAAMSPDLRKSFDAAREKYWNAR